MNVYIYYSFSERNDTDDVEKHSCLLAVRVCHALSFLTTHLTLGMESMLPASITEHSSFNCYLPALRNGCGSNGQDSPALRFVLYWVFVTGSWAPRLRRPQSPREHIWMIEGSLPSEMPEFNSSQVCWFK